MSKQRKMIFRFENGSCFFFKAPLLLPSHFACNFMERLGDRRDDCVYRSVVWRRMKRHSRTPLELVARGGRLSNERNLRGSTRVFQNYYARRIAVSLNGFAAKLPFDGRPSFLVVMLIPFRKANILHIDAHCEDKWPGRGTISSCLNTVLRWNYQNGKFSI